jgi:hypothetical protein
LTTDYDCEIIALSKEKENNRWTKQNTIYTW